MWKYISNPYIYILMAKKEDVEFFLHQMKDKIRVFDVVFRPRDKNIETLAELEISANERRECLFKLTYENYYSGPKNDTHDGSRPDYYEFGFKIKGVEIYIKVSLGISNKSVDCMSFHKAERTISYPLK